jgi:hypothetical protein
VTRSGPVAAVIRKDLTAIRRSKAVVIPMIAVPILLLVVLPIGIGLPPGPSTTPTSAAS